jgi:HlyD family secretion protein
MPTDGLARIDDRIAEVIPLDEYATWRAARAVGDYDLITFLMRAAPVGGVEGLQPGMTAWLHRR